MKTSFLKNLLTGLALWATVGAASAQTVIRIVASNGDRTATQTAISKLLAAGWTYRGLSGAVASGGDLTLATGSNFGAWNGTYQGQPVVIKASYSGALAGIAAVAGQTQQRFVVTDGTGSGAVPNPLTGTTEGTDYELGLADFGFSTNFQSTSPFNGTFQSVTYSSIIEEVVGISPLAFYGSPGFPGSPSSSNPAYQPNITSQLAKQLYTTGAVSLAQFTGDFSADTNKVVYAINRNTDAGQRFGALFEVGFTKYDDTVRAWFPTVSGGTTVGNITYGGTVTSQVLWPVNQQPGSFAVGVGSGGYNSGANLARALTLTLTEPAYKGRYEDPENPGNFLDLYPNATAGYYVGYLTPGDGDPRVLGTTGVVPLANRGVVLRFNGVPLTTANIQNGSYTAWIYNRILKPQSGLTGLKLTFANALRDQIKNVDAPSGGGLFDNSDVKVKRFTDGGFVVPK